MRTRRARLLFEFNHACKRFSCAALPLAPLLSLSFSLFLFPLLSLTPFFPVALPLSPRAQPISLSFCVRADFPATRSLFARSHHSLVRNAMGQYEATFISHQLPQWFPCNCEQEARYISQSLAFPTSTLCDRTFFDLALARSHAVRKHCVPFACLIEFVRSIRPLFVCEMQALTAEALTGWGHTIHGETWSACAVEHGKGNFVIAAIGIMARWNEFSGL